MIVTAILFGIVCLLGGWLALTLRGRGKSAARTSSSDTADFRDAALMADLLQAIRADALELHYQPKLHARSGELAGAEALIRWRHPKLGPIPPSMFVTLAEDAGHIRALTDWTVDQAIADWRRLKAAGLSHPIGLNVSAQLIGDADFIASLQNRIVAAGANIGIEVTETAVLANPQRALAHLEELARRGIPIAIDDYGVGLSPLAYLKQMPASELKLDALFVSGLTTSHRDPVIVRSTIELAHGLGLTVTAEGVEDLDTIALLRIMGCDQLQGYRISRALRLETYLDFARDHCAATFVEQIASRSFADMIRKAA